MDDATEPICVTDLEILKRLIEKLGLKYEIGEPTPGDGSCFLHGVRQNMIHLNSLGKWDGGVPETVHKLRSDTINHMKANKSKWIEHQYNPDSRTYEDPVLTEEGFEELIAVQSRRNEDTDNLGLFVRAVCEFLNIELRLVVTGSGTEIIESGIGGPYLKINEATNSSKRDGIFHLGLIKDDAHLNGHYQFLKVIVEDLDVNENQAQTQNSEGMYQVFLNIIWLTKIFYRFFPIPVEDKAVKIDKKIFAEPQSQRSLQRRSLYLLFRDCRRL